MLAALHCIICAWMLGIMYGYVWLMIDYIEWLVLYVMESKVDHA